MQMEQDKFIYKARKMLSENFITKYLFCCLKVKDKVNLNWEEMTPQQRKYHTRKLWVKARLVFHFIRMKQSASEGIGRNAAAGDGDDGEVDLENINSNQDNVWKWNIIREGNTLPQLWSFLVNTLTVYALFATPFVLVFDETSEVLRPFEMFVDVCFTIDIVCNFFKLGTNQKLSEINTYRLNYLKGLFLIDCIAALPGLVTGEKQGVNFFKLARFVHWNRFFDQLNFAVEKILMSWLGYTRQKVSEYVDFIKLELGVLLLTHIMAIIWIWIGTFDDKSWVNVFIAGEIEATG